MIPAQCPRCVRGTIIADEEPYCIACSHVISVPASERPRQIPRGRRRQPLIALQEEDDMPPIDEDPQPEPVITPEELGEYALGNLEWLYIEIDRVQRDLNEKVLHARNLYSIAQRSGVPIPDHITDQLPKPPSRRRQYPRHRKLAEREVSRTRVTCPCGASVLEGWMNVHLARAKVHQND